jgi:phage protein D
MPAEPVSIANVRPLLSLAGSERADLTAALHGLAVQLPASGRAHAEITLVNWGRRDDETGFQWLDIGLGDSLTIAFLASGRRVFSGEVTAIEERYGAGAPRLVLLVEDALHRLAKRRRSRVYEDQSADDVLNTLAGDHNLQADVAVSSETARWHQLNETDLNFLQRVCAAWAVPARIADGSLRVRPDEDDPEPVEVSPQVNADEIRIIADLNQQVTASGVRGWDFASGDAIEDDHARLQPAADGDTAADLLGTLGWGAAEWLGRPLPHNAGQARDWAAAAFRRQAGRFLHGELLLRGDPALLPGREVTLSQVSPRLQGRYRLTQVQHRFDPQNGYVSHCRIARPAWDGNA